MTYIRKRVYTPNLGRQALPMSQQMLEGAEWSLLLKLASPNALAFFVQASVSMAEIGFVGQLGTVSLAGLALMFPGLMLMQMLANGAIGGAVSSAVARALGAGDTSRAESLIWHAVVIAVSAGLTFFVLYELAGQRLLALSTATSDVLVAAHEYARIVFGGSAVLWLTALLSAVLRGTGNMKFPAALMVVGAGIQVPLAGTLILGWFGAPQLGVQGAAIAVIAVSAANGLILLSGLAWGRLGLRLRLPALKLRTELFANIFRVGALASLSPLLTVLTIMAMNVVIGGFGVAALAGYGIVSRLEFLLIPLVFGIGAAMTSMVGTNMGAGQVERAEHIGWLGGLTAAGLTGVVGVALALAPALWLGLFTDDPAAWSSGEAYLRIVGPVFAFQGLGLSLYFASQGAGRVGWPVLATLLRFVVGVGTAVIGVHVFDQGLVFVYACLAAGMLLYGALTASSVWLGAWRRDLESAI